MTYLNLHNIRILIFILIITNSCNLSKHKCSHQNKQTSLNIDSLYQYVMATIADQNNNSNCNDLNLVISLQQCKQDEQKLSRLLVEAFLESELKFPKFVCVNGHLYHSSFSNYDLTVHVFFDDDLYIYDDVRTFIKRVYLPPKKPKSVFNGIISFENIVKLEKSDEQTDKNIKNSDYGLYRIFATYITSSGELIFSNVAEVEYNNCMLIIHNK